MKTRVHDKRIQSFSILCSEKTNIKEHEFIGCMVNKGMRILYSRANNEIIYWCANSTDSFFAAELAKKLGLVWRKL